MNEPVFRDRVHAGQLLAEAVGKFAHRDDVLVLGLPRGGVPVAYEIAKKLHAPLDVIVVGKLGVPGYDELAMGAIASGAVRMIHDAVVDAMGISYGDLEQAAATELKELHRQELDYRGHTGVPQAEGKTVILVDDGIATGSTLCGAVQALRRQRPKQIIIAAPASSSDAYAMLKPMVDAFISPIVSTDFRSVGQWYQDFSHTTDAEVRQLLFKAGTPLLAGSPPHECSLTNSPFK